MKSNLRKPLYNLLGLGFWIVAAILVRNYFIKKDINVIKNADFSIGKVTLVVKGGKTVYTPIYKSGSFMPSINYDYIVKGDTFSGSIGLDIYDINLESVKIGNQYMLVYERDKPQESLLLINYKTDTSNFEETKEKILNVGLDNVFKKMIRERN